MIRANSPTARRGTVLSIRRGRSVLLALAGLVALTAACASTGGSAGERLRVTLVDYRNGQEFELLSESHTSAIELYSKPRAEASAKVLPDDVMDALVSELESQGFDDHAQEGGAPSRGGTVLTRALEIEEDGAPAHWVVGSGTDAAEKQRFNVCLNTVIQVFSAAKAYQTIDNADGAAIFSESPSGARP